MSLLASLRRLAGCALAAATCAIAAQAATAPGPSAADPEGLSRALRAVVGLQVRAAEGAQSAETLGRQRSGSGVVIGADGLILTIGYLMLEADAIQVTTHDNRVIPATPVAYDIDTGFGLVRALLPLPGVEPVALAEAAGTPVASRVLAATGGADGGIGVTQLVSARPFSGYWEYHIENALFTSPPLPNHSGAAIFNRSGELLGIGSLFVHDALQDGSGMQGNMFVPVDLLKPVLDEMQRTGSTRASHRPWLGLSSAVDEGRVRIVRVNRGSPAQEAGLAPGDIVLAIDGQPVATLEAFYKKLWSRQPAAGDVQLTILKGKATREVIVRPVDRMQTLRKPAGI